jgi:NADH:ubiquinone oxidoreductase subunit F (NADH-binding)
LVTVSGEVERPGVHEIALGTSVGHALGMAGGPHEPAQAVLVGGVGGDWLPLPHAASLPLDYDDPAGARLGAGALVALPATACGLAETARIMRYLAAESAAQCGPCMFGLPAISEDLDHLVRGVRGGEEVHSRLQRRLQVISERGACAHPDGAVRLVASALRTFGADLAEHLAGRPCDGTGRSWLPIPASRPPSDWR